MGREARGTRVVMDRKIPEEIVSNRTVPEGFDEVNPCGVCVLIVLVVERCLLTVHSKMKRERARNCFFLKKS